MTWLVSKELSHASPHAGLRKTGAVPPLEASESAAAAPVTAGRDANAKKRKSVRFNIPAKGASPDKIPHSCPLTPHCWGNQLLAHSWLE